MIFTDVPFMYMPPDGIILFYGADKIGFTPEGSFVISAYSTRDFGGHFLMSIPISNLKFRKQSPTKAWYKRINLYELLIADDYGSQYKFIGYRSFIDALERDCKENLVDFSRN